MKKATENLLIYESKRQSVLYFVSVLTLATSVFVLYMIFSDWEEFASEYSSKFSAIGWTIFMIITGNIMFVCVLWLSGKYILQIKQADENHLFIKTWSILGFHKTQKFPAEILKTAVSHIGMTKTHRSPVVIAPYSVLKTLSGKKLILDEQGSWTSTKKR